MKKQKEPQFAVIDIGSNAIRLQISKYSGANKITPVLFKREPVRIGTDVFSTRKISHATMLKVAGVINEFKTLIHRSGCSHICTVATEAVRTADNSKKFINTINKRTGILIEIISGHEEGRLMYLGALGCFPDVKIPQLYTDIGGGSWELVYADKKHIHAIDSVQIGAVKLYDRFCKSDPPTENELHTLTTFTAKQLAKTLFGKSPKKIKRLIGTGGSMTTLALILNNGAPLTAHERNRIFTLPQINKVYKQLCSLPLSKRKNIPGLPADRADIIIPGIAVIITIMKYFSCAELSVLSKGLREGIMTDYISRCGYAIKSTQYQENICSQAIINLGLKYQFDISHAKMTADIASDIYKCLAEKKIISYSGNDAKIIKAAALLHDIGYFISSNKHHIHSEYLIYNSELIGFYERELAVIAAVARYHQSESPNQKQKIYGSLLKTDQQLVRQFAAIIRLADALHSTIAALPHPKIKITKEQLQVTFKTKKDISLVLNTAAKKAKLFEKIYKLKVIVSRG